MKNVGNVTKLLFHQKLPSNCCSHMPSRWLGRICPLHPRRAKTIKTNNYYWQRRACGNNGLALLEGTWAKRRPKIKNNPVTPKNSPTNPNCQMTAAVASENDWGCQRHSWKTASPTAPNAANLKANGGINAKLPVKTHKDPNVCHVTKNVAQSKPTMKQCSLSSRWRSRICPLHLMRAKLLKKETRIARTSPKRTPKPHLRPGQACCGLAPDHVKPHVETPTLRIIWMIDGNGPLARTSVVHG